MKEILLLFSCSDLEIRTQRDIFFLLKSIILWHNLHVIEHRFKVYRWMSFNKGTARVATTPQSSPSKFHYPPSTKKFWLPAKGIESKGTAWELNPGLIPEPNAWLPHPHPPAPKYLTTLQLHLLRHVSLKAASYCWTLPSTSHLCPLVHTVFHTGMPALLLLGGIPPFPRSMALIFPPPGTLSALTQPIQGQAPCPLNVHHLVICVTLWTLLKYSMMVIKYYLYFGDFLKTAHYL